MYGSMSFYYGLGEKAINLIGDYISNYKLMLKLALVALLLSLACAQYN